MSIAESLLQTVAGLFPGTSKVAEESIAEIEDAIDGRLRRIPTHLNAYGYDAFGFSPVAARRALVMSALLYRYWFRVETHGIDRLPKGRMLLISNHAGQIAIDAAMIGAAMVLEAEPPRIIRGMGEYWLPTVPWVNIAMVRTGSVVGTRKNCVALLEADECVIAFPEGVRGMNKLIWERYQLQEFGYGFMRLLLGMPAFPVTLTWPWLGLLGLIPLPVKYHIHFGEPLRFEGNPNDEDEVIAEKVEQVKERIAAMLAGGLAARRSLFW